jgi:hypothetical protein
LCSCITRNKKLSKFFLCSMKATRLLPLSIPLLSSLCLSPLPSRVSPLTCLFNKPHIIQRKYTSTKLKSKPIPIQTNEKQEYKEENGQEDEYLKGNEECMYFKRNAAHHSTTQHYVRSTTQHNAAQCSTMQHNAVQCSTMQHNAAQCSTTQHYAALRSTTQHYAALRSTTQNKYSTLDTTPALRNARSLHQTTLHSAAPTPAQYSVASNLCSTA